MFSPIRFNHLFRIMSIQDNYAFNHLFRIPDKAWLVQQVMPMIMMRM
jgi:hypothetical protein